MVTALAVALLAAAPTARAVEASFAPDAAWCWFQDPRAVYDHGRTFTGYVTAAGDIGVASYDHGTNELRRSVIARGFQRDDHAAPALQGVVGRPRDGDLVRASRAADVRARDQAPRRRVRLDRHPRDRLE